MARRDRRLTGADRRRLVGHNDGVSSPPHSEDAADTAAAGDAAKAPPARRQVVLLAAAAVVALLLDALTKTLAVATLEGQPPLRLLGGAVYLTLIRNSGAAFSMASGLTWLLTLIALGVVVVIVRLAPRLRSTGWALALGLVLGGALGNLADRMLRAPGPLRGHVVDFVSLLAPDGRVWPVFNLADSAIVCGGVLLVVLTLMGRDFEGNRVAREDKAR